MANERLCNTLLVGVSGSVHALELHAYLTRFRETLAPTIKIIMTASARRVVQQEAIALFVDDKVFADLWDRSPEVDRAPHIQLTRWADLFVVVPATANIIGKAAGGIADDLLSTAILSSPKPVVFAPAMNPAMWESRVVQRNIKLLQADGHYIVPPEPAVSVTSGEWDRGLTPTPETLVRHLRHVRMKELKEGYWEEATRDPPLTPAQRKIQALAARKSLA